MAKLFSSIVAFVCSATNIYLLSKLTETPKIAKNVCYFYLKLKLASSISLFFFLQNLKTKQFMIT